MASYPPIKELGKPHPTSSGNDNQVMIMDEESPIKTLTVYETTRGNQDEIVDIDLHDDIVDRGPKPIEELVKL